MKKMNKRILIIFLLYLIIGAYCYDSINNIKFIHVLYTVTKHSGYLLGLKTSIISLITNLDPDIHVNIYVFIAQEDRMFVDRNVLDELQDKMLIDAPTLTDISNYLEQVSDERTLIVVFGCEELPESLPKHLIFGNEKSERIYNYIKDAEVLWCRYTALYYINVLIGVKHIIYLDTDTIVNKDVSSLIYADMDKHPLYAVENCKIKNKDMWPKFCDIIKPSSYMSSFCSQCSFANGVFVMNLDYWTNNEYMKKIEEIMSTFPEPYIADTAILNMLYYNTYGKLDSKFNSMGLGVKKRYPDSYASNAVVLHWTGPLKWWNDDTNIHLVKSYYPEKYDINNDVNKILQEDNIYF